MDKAAVVSLNGIVDPVPEKKVVFQLEQGGSTTIPGALHKPGTRQRFFVCCPPGQKLPIGQIMHVDKGTSQ